MSELVRALEIVEKLRDLSDKLGFGQEDGDRIAAAADYLESLYAEDRTAWPRNDYAASELRDMAGCFPYEIAVLMEEAGRMIMQRGAYLSVAGKGVNHP